MAGHVLPDHNPHRGLQLSPRMIVIGGAAAALVVLLVIRGRGAQATAPVADATDPSALGALGTPSTFADNGGQAAQLGSDVTGALGGVSTSLDSFGSGISSAFGQLGDQVDALSARVDTLAQPTAATSSPSPETFSNGGLKLTGPGALAVGAALVKSAGSPSGKTAPKTTTASKPKTTTTKPNPNKGAHYTMPKAKPKTKGAPAGKTKH